MKKIVDVKFDKDSIKNIDYFICCIGLESRSRYLLDLFRPLIDIRNILVFEIDTFLYDDKIQKTEAYKDYNKYVKKLENEQITIKRVGYKEAMQACKEIIRFLKSTNATINVFIDYSSMPRTWYSRLPMELNKSVSAPIQFLYVLGEYPGDYSTYPSAGIESYSSIGIPSLQDKKRLHVIGVGYDIVRTEALVSILDPEMYTVCSAYYSHDIEMRRKLRNINKKSIDQAISSHQFLIDDFSFMVAKLCEITNEYLAIGDVILVPDGPKPLIMAMSLIPQLLNKKGVVCIHVSRNIKCYEFLDILPTETVLSFSISDKMITPSD